MNYLLAQLLIGVALEKICCVLMIYCVLNNNAFELFSREHIIRLMIDLNVDKRFSIFTIVALQLSTSNAAGMLFLFID